MGFCSVYRGFFWLVCRLTSYREIRIPGVRCKFKIPPSKQKKTTICIYFVALGVTYLYNDSVIKNITS